MQQSIRSPVIVVGAGGHAQSVVEAVQCMGLKILGYVSNEEQHPQGIVSSLTYLGGDSRVGEFDPATVQLVNAIGSVSVTEKRAEVFHRFRAMGFVFASVIHPSTILAKNIVLGEGSQVMAGAIIQPNVELGMNGIINTGARVDHDCKVGDHVHISCGAIVCGGVHIENFAHIGPGATILQGVAIEESSLVAAGSVVTRNVSAHSRVGGIPARDIGRSASDLSR
jgi:sugar O-acyltransferase (sialic acid O-acetyltransferase NeuD family)